MNEKIKELPLQGKYLKYSPEITFEVFKLVWDKLISLGYRSFSSTTVEYRYNEFKGNYPYFRESVSIPLEFTCYNNKDTCIKTTVQEILGYDPFIKETTTVKDWNNTSKEELLTEAKCRYPVGCKIKLIGRNIGGDFKNEVRFTKYQIFDFSEGKQLFVDGNLLLFHEGVWAEIESLPEVETMNVIKEVFVAQNKQINPKSIEKCCRSFQIGQTVYHRSVYEHKEPLKIVGILEDKLLLEGDFSGGTHNVIQRDWLPIKGTSTIYNHAFKLNARKAAIEIETLARTHVESQSNTFKDMMLMAHYVMLLTNDVSLNPECE